MPCPGFRVEFNVNLTDPRLLLDYYRAIVEVLASSGCDSISSHAWALAACEGSIVKVWIPKEVNIPLQARIRISVESGEPGMLIGIVKMLIKGMAERGITGITMD
ncbi:MAG: hypothetical protein F7C08_03975 [Desulfurococcales archaeon]|nr:hypothetical protein [Desulfurococcales archaeon]MCE4605671.1 hypothetical protein [Desulfurococcales archaeon]